MRVITACGWQARDTDHGPQAQSSFEPPRAHRAVEVLVSFFWLPPCLAGRAVYLSADRMLCCLEGEEQTHAKAHVGSHLWGPGSFLGWREVPATTGAQDGARRADRGLGAQGDGKNGQGPARGHVVA